MSAGCVGIQTANLLRWKRRGGNHTSYAYEIIVVFRSLRLSTTRTDVRWSLRLPRTRTATVVKSPVAKNSGVRPLDFENKIAPRSRLHYLHILSFLLPFPSPLFLLSFPLFLSSSPPFLLFFFFLFPLWQHEIIVVFRSLRISTTRTDVRWSLRLPRTRAATVVKSPVAKSTSTLSLLVSMQFFNHYRITMTTHIAVDSSTPSFSLSSHRPSFISLFFTSRFLDS